MALKIGEDTIDGVRVLSQQLPAMRAMALASRLAKLFGPLASGVKNVSVTNLGALMEGELSAVAPVFGEFLSQLDDEAFMYLVRELLRETQAVGSDGKLVTLRSDEAINDVFNGKLGTLIKVVVWVGRLNFASFTAALPAGVGAPGKGETRPNLSTSPS